MQEKENSTFETIMVQGNHILEQLTKLLHEGNVRRVVVKQDELTIAEFPLTAGAQPRDIVAGPDGNLWFTEYAAGQLAQITPAGVVTEVQAVKGGPWGIGRGLDRTIWITVFDGNRLGRLTLAP